MVTCFLRGFTTTYMGYQFWEQGQSGKPTRLCFSKPKRHCKAWEKVNADMIYTNTLF